MVIPLIKAVFFETIVDLVYWPFWWYSFGLQRVGQWAHTALKDANDAVGFTLWLKAMGEPMYGQHDWQGRLISFWFRVIILVFRFGVMVLWIGCIVGVVGGYVLLLPVSLWELIMLGR